MFDKRILALATQAITSPSYELRSFYDSLTPADAMRVAEMLERITQRAALAEGYFTQRNAGTSDGLSADYSRGVVRRIRAAIGYVNP